LDVLYVGTMAAEEHHKHGAAPGEAVERYDLAGGYIGQVKIRSRGAQRKQGRLRVRHGVPLASVTTDTASDKTFGYCG
jgi:hypothetical protein